MLECQTCIRYVIVASWLITFSENSINFSSEGRWVRGGGKFQVFTSIPG